MSDCIQSTNYTRFINNTLTRKKDSLHYISIIVWRIEVKRFQNVNV